MRWKITTCLLQREQLWAITYKKATNQLPLWRCREQKQGIAPDPCMQHQQGGGQTSEATPSAPPTHWCTLPSPYVRNQPALLGRASNLLLVLALSCYSTSFNKALPGILICPFINFYWWKSPRTQVDNTFIYLITINTEHYGESQLHGASRRTVLDNEAPCLLPLSIRSVTFFLLYT